MNKFIQNSHLIDRMASDVVIDPTRPSIELSNDQQEALKDAIEAIRKRDSNVAILTGSAGTGKTTLLRRVVEILTSDEVAVHLTATTNKAAKVLSEATGFSAQTIHSALALKPVSREGKTELKKSGLHQLRPRSVLVVEEASMIDANLLAHIQNDANELEVFVLFVGDRCQLPPVADDPKLFEQGYPIFELKTIHRQSFDNPVIELATALREVILGRRLELPKIATKLNEIAAGIQLVGEAEFLRRIDDAFTEPASAEDVRVLAYTNDCTVAHNQRIRRTIYGRELADACPIVEGEVLIANSVVKEGLSILLPNDAEVVALRVETNAVNRGVTGSRVWVEVDGPFGVGAVRPLFVAKDRADVRHAVAALRSRAAELQNQSRQSGTTPSLDKLRRQAWAEYYRAVDEFADLRPSYACTAHKAQGSTFRLVFLDLPDLGRCKDMQVRQRLLYTAITRTSNLVVVNTGGA